MKNKKNKNSTVRLGLILGFIVAIMTLSIFFYVVTETYNSRDETEFKIDNNLIGTIYLKKKVNSGSDPPK
ncbi:hypothetical protein [Chryseobacterium aquaticum]|uniref:hypothetical protein n=1 Tax=Chryseobacterium aquaticum TaxID=452084 RepID=UPI002FC92B5E